jgi:biuret amidohydrolase
MTAVGLGIVAGDAARQMSGINGCDTAMPIAMSAFEGTPLAMALRDCGLISFMICGVATEIGIDHTVRHGADLGLIPIVIEDACGHGHRAAAERSIENMRFMGDAIVTNVGELRQALGPMPRD